MIAEANLGAALFSATLYLIIAGLGYLTFLLVDYTVTTIKEFTNDR